MPTKSVSPRRVITTIIVIALILFLITAASQSFVSISYGSVGIRTRFGQIVDEPIGPGLHLKIPFVDDVLVYRTQKIVYQTLFTTSSGSFTNAATSYDISANMAAPEASATTDYSRYSADDTGQAEYADYQDVAVDTTTKDGQQVKITFSLRFSLDPDKIKQIANTLGTEAEVVEKIVKTDSRVMARNIPRNYSALDLYTGNIDKVSTEVQEALTPTFSQNGLILDEFFIRSIHFRDEYVQTIEDKQIEKEKIATEEFKAQQEEFKKQALITKAQGEAEAQRLQQQTLTKELIQKLWIEKWNGTLPTTMTGEDGVLLNINN